jgi:hypothetical protein
MITATFRACWEKEPPADEPRAKGGKFGPVGKVGTGRGDEIDVDFRIVTRQIGVVRASVTVRYDAPKKD